MSLVYNKIRGDSSSKINNRDNNPRIKFQKKSSVGLMEVMGSSKIKISSNNNTKEALIIISSSNNSCNNKIKMITIEIEINQI